MVWLGGAWSGRDNIHIQLAGLGSVRQGVVRKGKARITFTFRRLGRVWSGMVWLGMAWYGIASQGNGNILCHNSLIM